MPPAGRRRARRLRRVARAPRGRAPPPAGWRQLARARSAATMSGSVESGRPTPTRTRWKSTPPSSRLSDFSPLWPASPPPRRTRMSPNGQVDLVVEHEQPVEVEAERAARRPDGAPRLVHVGLRLEHRDARAAGARAALAQLAGELLARLGQVPALDQRVGDLEADVVRAVRVAAPGIAEADDEPVDRCGGEELHALAVGRPGSAVRGLRPRSSCRPRPGAPPPRPPSGRRRAPSPSRSRPRPAPASAASPWRPRCPGRRGA